jgi:hypothetical protein
LIESEYRTGQQASEIKSKNDPNLTIASILGSRRRRTDGFARRGFVEIDCVGRSGVRNAQLSRRVSRCFIADITSRYRWQAALGKAIETY